MEWPHLVKTVWLERVNHKFITKSSYDDESPHTSDQLAFIIMQKVEASTDCW